MYALDNLRDSDSALAGRYGYCVYHGWFASYSARNCHYSSVGTRHSRSEGPVGC